MGLVKLFTNRRKSDEEVSCAGFDSRFRLAVVRTEGRPLPGPYDVLLRSAKIELGLKSKDFDRVIELLTEAVDNYENPLEAHFYLGLVYAERAQHLEMMNHFRAFEEICARAETLNDKKLKQRCQKDKMPQQIADTRVHELKTSYESGVQQLRSVDSIRAEMAEIVDDSVKAVQQDLIRRLLDRAKGLFDDCLIIDDTVSGVWTNLASIERQRGNNEEALQKYRRAYELNPKNAMMIFDLASVEFDLKDYESAAKHYGEFARLDEQNAEVAYINQAMAYQAMNDLDGLQAALDRVLEISPDNYEMRYQRGMTFVRRAAGQVFRDSIRLLDSLLERNPRDAQLQQTRERLFAFRDEMNLKSLEDFKVAAEGTGNDVVYWYWYGNSAFFLDRPEEATRAYERCTEVDKSYRDCWCQLQILYARAGKRELAEQASEKCETQ